MAYEEDNDENLFQVEDYENFRKLEDEALLKLLGLPDDTSLDITNGTEIIDNTELSLLLISLDQDGSNARKRYQRQTPSTKSRTSRQRKTRM